MAAMIRNYNVTENTGNWSHKTINSHLLFKENSDGTSTTIDAYRIGEGWFVSLLTRNREGTIILENKIEIPDELYNCFVADKAIESMK